MGVLDGIEQWLSGGSTPTFECQYCGEGFDRQRQICPSCGGGHIDRADVGADGPNE